MITPFFYLETNELWLLAKNFSPFLFIGFENPEQGLFADEIELMENKAAKSLVQKGLAIFTTEKELIVHEDLLKFVKTCVHPQHTIVILTSYLGNNLSNFINISDEHIIEHFEEYPGLHCLRLIPNWDSLISLISDKLRLNEFIEFTSASSFSVEEALLLIVVEQVQKGEFETAHSSMVKEGIDIETADSFIQSIKHPLTNSALVVIRNQQDAFQQEVDGFGILESTSGSWLLSPFQKNGISFVECKPTNKNEILNLLMNLIPK